VELPFTLVMRGDVRVLRFDYAGAADTPRDSLMATLTEEDAVAVRRFALPELRDRALLRRAFVRGALGQELHLAPHEVPLVKGRRGKPEIAGHPRLFVSLSHTDDVVLLAVARGHLHGVGVDVERMGAEIDPDLLAPTVLHPDEARAMDGLVGEARKRAFLRVWCRKESALKVTGIGLLDDLTALSVLHDDVDLGACHDPRVTKDDARVVRIEDLALDEAHVAALATTR
jgi:4'-phosphopantetheinyl transferase